MKVIGAAARSNAIVSSLFPEAIRDRLLEHQEQDDDATSRNLQGFLRADKSKFNKFNKALLFETKPIADLFPETTVIFADIVNFTSWSSVRDPSQVFTLLEVVYNAFDDIARKRGVFKVETIGDCYVAVCGLPEPAKDHAVRMARFAKDCMNKMWLLVKMLEATLGPDTCDLTLRMGLHSGPVTAGVLRGEKSRFQLFGDTMNTGKVPFSQLCTVLPTSRPCLTLVTLPAARMESTGFPNCIQISQATADLLVAAGKQAWIKPRADMVNAKGKGLMQTYILEMNRSIANSHSGGSSDADSTTNAHSILFELAEFQRTKLHEKISNKDARLVEWMAEILMAFLKEIAVRRSRTNNWSKKPFDEATFGTKIGSSVLGEVKEIVTLPSIASNDGNDDESHPDDDVDPAVGDQLRHYLSKISSMYPDNPCTLPFTARYIVQ